jgi:aromatic ring-opening dioxygenase catalytic subunit (LigB family)
MKSKPDVLFLSHGGGPMPLLGDEGHAEMVSCLKNIAKKLKKPSAILVISAHWEEEVASITSAAAPSLIYDYTGFPAESYKIKYPCVGESELARQIAQVLEGNDIAARLDSQRGFDHGLFVPLKILYPEADIPCVQLSLVKTLDPAQHIQIGRALQGLNYNNLLIVGSGFSFHNMRAFFEPETSESKMMNASFESWLLDICSNRQINEEERARQLIEWEGAPYARFCHPREEHLLPLHICYGIAEAACSEFFELSILNKQSSMYLWQ